MKKTIHTASLLTVAASFLTIVFSAAGSGAAAQDVVPTDATVAIQPKSDLFLSKAQPGFDSADAANPAPRSTDPAVTTPVNGETLADMVAEQPQVAEQSQEITCLASAIYHEAGHRSLDGQLAVGRVIVARTKSGRFPASYCGVVMQHSQFSFVHHNTLPHVDTGSKYWHNAVAIASIAHQGNVQSRAEGALFFHSAKISPKWRRTRVAEVDGNVFYR